MSARSLLLWLLLPYLFWLIFFYQYHFIDGVNLALHEAGHMVFGFGGQTLHFLGGTLGQLAFPLAFVVHFWRQGQKFEAAVCAIWLAESLMYTAEYLGDARLMQLPLVGGGIHDWNWLLSRWGMLGVCEEISGLIHVSASMMLIGAWCYAFRMQSENKPGREL